MVMAKVGLGWSVDSGSKANFEAAAKPFCTSKELGEAAEAAFQMFIDAPPEVQGRYILMVKKRMIDCAVKIEQARGSPAGRTKAG